MTVSPKWKLWPVALRSPFHPFLISAFGTVTVLVVGLLVSAFRSAPRNLPRTGALPLPLRE